MKSKYFRLIGINEPGKVNLYLLGTVNLSSLTDDKLNEIYNEGKFPYLVITEEGLKKYYPEKVVAAPVEAKSDNSPDPKNTNPKKKDKEVLES